MSKFKRFFTLLLICILAITSNLVIVEASSENDDISKMKATILEYTTTWKRDSSSGKYTYPINVNSDI